MSHGDKPVTSAISDIAIALRQYMSYSSLFPISAVLPPKAFGSTDDIGANMLELQNQKTTGDQIGT
jgi:hypothetical protein